MAYRLRFGTYDLGSGLRPASVSTPRDLAEQERPREDGALQQVARTKGLMLPVRGSFTAADADTLQARIDAIAGALGALGQQPLWFGRDDRYASAQYDSIDYSYGDGTQYGLIVNVSINFKADPPYFYAVAATTVSALAAGGTVTPGGNAKTVPLWTLTIGTGGTGTITLANTTTNETATLTGTFAGGDVITLNRAGYVVQVNGTANFGILGGRIPSLAVGANVITVAATTISVATMTCIFTNRYSS